MSKVNYPENGGLSGILKTPLNDTIHNLEKAKDACSYVIPSDFSYKKYLQNLSSVIDNYISKVNTIYGNALEVDNTFKFAFESIAVANSKLDLNVIDERDRLVK